MWGRGKGQYRVVGVGELLWWEGGERGGLSARYTCKYCSSYTHTVFVCVKGNDNDVGDVT